jgi:hypothetical protein
MTLKEFVFYKNQGFKILKKYINHFLLSSGFLLLSLFSAKAEGTLEVINSATGLVLSTETTDGILDFGSMDALGMNKGNTALVDGVFFVNSSNELVPSRETADLTAGAFYVMGADTGSSAIQITAQNLEPESASDLLMSSTGEMEIYISKSTTPWEDGAMLDDSMHPLLPDNNFSVVIKGNQGILDTEPVTDTDSIIDIDLGVKVLLENPQGATSSVITFTLVSGSN